MYSEIETRFVWRGGSAPAPDMNEDESGAEVAVEDDEGGEAEPEDADGEAEGLSALVVRCICARYVVDPSRSKKRARRGVGRPCGVDGDSLSDSGRK